MGSFNLAGGLLEMGFLSIMGNSFGCSASGERLVSATRDVDVQEAMKLLEYNPRLDLRNYDEVQLYYSQGLGDISLLEWGLTLELPPKVSIDKGGDRLGKFSNHGHLPVLDLRLLLSSICSCPSGWQYCLVDMGRGTKRQRIQVSKKSYNLHQHCLLTSK